MEPNRDQAKERPTEHLAPFDPQKHWDADSTPPAFSTISRKIGELFPGSGARTPDIEAAIVLASLMHDVAYYYGGSASEKKAADERFRKQIPFFASLLNQDNGRVAKVTAFVDELAVTIGGGYPFQKDYSWSFGFEKEKRGYTELEQTEAMKIRRCAQEVFVNVVREIAAQKFELSDVLRKKLAAAGSEYRDELKDAVVRLAKELTRLEFRGVPGLSGEGKPGLRPTDEVMPPR
ncbi:MAG: hypothetical protein NOF05_15890 [Candidatus Accumulibacter phosphatis]|uniref:Uncharacterized protein n=2 Tax=Candidatus Accumulibacter TaxID=327159 RepID=A0A080M0S7_9PROT|nr:MULTISPECIES: hypothetical protein [Candidatus Accumulibacter]MCQ1550256.1 hypothetical protein [Candidatus Accumulibacter phosphatis]KFB74813.1 MAG: hypothetical protein AW06_004225 [Candidatus Accumulibacter cognatus]MBL8399461.1 hypothetical protein [Accumulibacter sp.]MBN8520214.1 hypothetical protein [Accumulibacter sp.]MBO3711454.1 hypothetical protein [Accumulibacter sp.]